jgi:hypothetical protein
MHCCCESLQTSVERGEIVHNKLRGCFWFYFKHDYDDSYGLYRLGYCPFCGAELPKDRMDDFEYILEKHYGISLCDVDPHNPDTYPSEFQTDEWWKKRGL